MQQQNQTTGKRVCTVGFSPIKLEKGKKKKTNIKHVLTSNHAIQGTDVQYRKRNKKKLQGQ